MLFSGKLYEKKSSCEHMINFFILLIISLFIFEASSYGEFMKNDLFNAKKISTKMPEENIEGDWSGELDFGGMKITLFLRINQNSSGNIIATFESIDGLIPKTQVVNIMLNSYSLKFELPTLASIYEGHLNKQESEISGNLIYNNTAYPLILKKGILDKTLFRKPQEPLPPFPYIEEVVKYKNDLADITLEGTLTLPSSQGQFPAVLLIAGSAPYDRNATQNSHKPFMILADHLTRKGIAVLRFDKRGVNQSTGTYETADGKDFADDVLAGVNYLRTRPEINHLHIGLVGHSEGAVLAPMVAVKAKDLAFLVLMAGATVNGKEIMIEQHSIARHIEGVPKEIIAEESALLNEVYEFVKNDEQAAKQIHNVLTKYLERKREVQVKPIFSITGIEVNQASLNKIITRINTPWFRYFLINEPTTYLKQIKMPICALYFELDSQVSPKQNMPLLVETLDKVGHENYSVKELPKHNHMLQSCKTGTLAEYIQNPETVSPLILNIMTDWILDQTVPNRNK